MLGKLARLLRGRSADPPAKLRGRPRIRREKTYAADSGYVYHYTYEGYRTATRDGEGGREFVFRCTSDRASRLSITVFAPDSAFARWERAQSRELNAVERYAVVKMQLFETFDEFERISQDLVRRLTAEQVERQVAALDL